MFSKFLIFLKIDYTLQFGWNQLFAKKNLPRSNLCSLWLFFMGSRIPGSQESGPMFPHGSRLLEAQQQCYSKFVSQESRKSKSGLETFFSKPGFTFLGRESKSGLAGQASQQFFLHPRFTFPWGKVISLNLQARFTFPSESLKTQIFLAGAR